MAEIGRPSKFNESLKNVIINLYKQGKTDQEVADIVGICVKTIYNWKSKSKDFLLAVKDSKSIADDIVVATLFQKATGYSHKETKLFQHEGCIISEDVIKNYAPDTTAITFWLKNRRPDEWREKQEIEHSGEVKKEITVKKIDIEERIKQLKGEE